MSAIGAVRLALTRPGIGTAFPDRRRTLARTVCAGCLARGVSRGAYRRRLPGDTRPPIEPSMGHDTRGQVAMSSDPESTLEYDPLALEADPYPIYARLRDEAPAYAGE